MKENLYASYVNMDHRGDRNDHMKAELAKAGIEAERQRGMPFHEYTGPREKVWVMEKRTKGAVGCHYSQVAIMEKALSLGKHAFVMEDDLVFCSDFQERLDHIDKFVANEDWDIIWLGGTCHTNPHRWHTGTNHDLVGSDMGCDMELTNDSRIVRTYGAFSTYAYIVNVKSISKILKMLDENVHLSMGIDWLFIKLQPQLKTFMYVPGCVKQIDSISDIGGAMTIFSNFEKLNGTVENSTYWFQDYKDQFNPSTFNWGEAGKYESKIIEPIMPTVEPQQMSIEPIKEEIVDFSIQKRPDILSDTIIQPDDDVKFEFVNTSTAMAKLYNSIELSMTRYYRCLIEYFDMKPDTLGAWVTALKFTTDIDKLAIELGDTYSYMYKIKIIHEINKEDYESQKMFSIPLNQYIYHV